VGDLWNLGGTVRRRLQTTVAFLRAWPLNASAFGWALALLEGLVDGAGVGIVGLGKLAIFIVHFKWVRPLLIYEKTRVSLLKLTPIILGPDSFALDLIRFKMLAPPVVQIRHHQILLRLCILANLPQLILELASTWLVRPS
jgi:hypothetical protein